MIAIYEIAITYITCFVEQIKRLKNELRCSYFWRVNVHVDDEIELSYFNRGFVCLHPHENWT